MSDPVQVPKGPSYYDPEHDANNGNPWSDMDIGNLVHMLKHGGTVEGAAQLCRQGTVEDVRCKAQELGLINSTAE
jgi:hypothetical protein